MKNLQRLFEIGNELAAIQGGSCYNVIAFQRDKKVKFYCVENDERFTFAFSFDEIKKHYGLDLTAKPRNKDER